MAIGKTNALKKGVDTSDATATSVDILLGKTAYANDEKIVGTIPTYNNEHENGYVSTRSMKLYLDATKSCYYMFYKYSGETIPDGVLEFSDTSNVTEMNFMFSECSNLTTIPLIDTSNATNMNYIFDRCSRLTTIPQLDTSKATNMSNMFYRCYALETVPLLDARNAIYLGSTFTDCRKLTTVQLINTSNVKNFDSTFYNCSSLTTIQQLNLINATNTSSMFSRCTNLTNLDLLNIQVNLQIGSGTSWGHLLTIDSLVNTCKECIKQSESRTLTVGTANLEKLANVYVKFVDPTQTTIPVGSKGDVVVCESTDAGAMLISDYMTLKLWTLA